MKHFTTMRKTLKIFLILCVIVSNTEFIGWGQTNEEGVLINGVRWATRNVDKPGTFTAKPEDAGMLYQWGSKVGWSSTDSLYASDGISSWRDLSEFGEVWLREKDPCPKGWRVPTKAEMESLISSGSEWKQKNDINGRWFHNEKLFFPIAGSRDFKSAKLKGVGGGYYWSNTPSTNASAHYLGFYSAKVFSPDEYGSARGCGHLVRCVKE